MTSAMEQAMPAHLAIAAMQNQTRQKSGFDDAENKLCTHTVGGYPVEMMKTMQPNRFLAHPISTIASAVFGSKNPMPRPITDKDEVWLLDNTVFQDANDPTLCNAEFVACVFSNHSHEELENAVAQVAGIVGIGDNADARKTIAKRLVPFLLDIEPGKQVTAIHGPEDYKLVFSPGGPNGISSDIRQVPSKPSGTVATIADVPASTTQWYKAKTFFTGAEGWTVISDIDDTIKHTMTSDPKGILQTTFVDHPKPIEGMPQLYAWIKQQLGEAAPFFYLSASPYNLYPFLRGFRDDNYPHGTLILRDASWMSLAGLLSNLTLHTQDYKVSRMQKIHQWLPKKKLICIGDSTQSDPEAYGQIYREFPGWVKVICIRKVTDISEVGIAEKNDPKRFEKAFHDVPKTAWYVFTEPKELYKVIGDAVAADTQGK